MSAPTLLPQRVDALSRRRAFHRRIAERAWTRRAVAAAPEPEPAPPPPEPEPEPAPINTADAALVECVTALVMLLCARFPAPEKQWPRRELIAISAAAFGVEVRDILSDRRTANIVRPRMTAAWLCKRFTPSSYQAIGKALGRHDHTTALHAVSKVERVIAALRIDCDEEPEAWARAIAEVPAAEWRGR